MKNIQVYPDFSGDSGKNLRMAASVGTSRLPKSGNGNSIVAHVDNAEESIQDHEETSSDRRDGPIGL
jgi:hypothetical protein